jgi:hypothetical protein
MAIMAPVAVRKREAFMFADERISWGKLKGNARLQMLEGDISTFCKWQRMNFDARRACDDDEGGRDKGRECAWRVCM